MLLGILRFSLVCPVVLTNDAEPEVIPRVQVIERVLCQLLAQQVLLQVLKL